MEIIIRPLKMPEVDDLFILAERFATSFRTNKKLFLSTIETVLADESAFLRIAEYDSKLTGYCLGFDHYTFYANGRVSWLEEIMVEEKFRHLGIGTKLVESFEKWSKSRNSRLIALATRRAAPFYKGLGYEESAVYLRKILDPSK
ncbi:GNAT family N-acetyltransferase [Paenibacillus sp. sptzw28]|uniref:GNAT family N-acetyltransferase n=1 Tax=Paenibacillus sp. sptzw28 TaxID=715179 RepID=UPI001C6F55A2|nr:GNAT family N-acetyltransferase [Paenibacillus sp. sptzw28]QYR19313.1 GNAT family N-acetyltransferase [Paenibacillus sp. sptzw28]